MQIYSFNSLDSPPASGGVLKYLQETNIKIKFYTGKKHLCGDLCDDYLIRDVFLNKLAPKAAGV